MEIGYKAVLVNKIEFFKREYAARSFGELKDFVKCTIKSAITKMTLNISQTDLITKMTQGFNKYHL